MKCFQIAKNYVQRHHDPGDARTGRHAHGDACVWANVTIFLASDEAAPRRRRWCSGRTVKARRMLSYSAAGAITLPNAGEDMVAVLNGTNARSR
jgi:hypothetical protein